MPLVSFVKLDRSSCFITASRGICGPSIYREARIDLVFVSTVGASTPPPRGVLKLDVYGSSAKDMTHDLPHWMDSKRVCDSIVTVILPPLSNFNSGLSARDRQGVTKRNSLTPGVSVLLEFDASIPGS